MNKGWNHELKKSLCFEDRYAKKVKIAVIQMKVDRDVDKNITVAEDFIRKSVYDGADMVVLPEMFCCPYETSNFPIYAELEGGDIYNRLSSIASRFGIYLVAGSVPEIDKFCRVYNTSYIFDRSGTKIGKHRKMHLFDIDVEGGQYFKESDTLTPGNSICVFNTEFGKIGLCICYDFRFVELSRIMVDEGANIIIVPAAFNMTTGPAHWEHLFKMRAVDNQVYTIGAAPARDYDSSYTSYGNSIVASPWGEVVNKMNEEEGYFIVDLDLNYIDKIRKELPLLKQRRHDIYTISKK